MTAEKQTGGGGVKHLTLLHSNDMHGDFHPETVNGRETGGLALLSGYLHRCREEEENVLYAISGDMFRGSIIDSEYMGLSTIEMVNLLHPDVTTIGNHEVDYGLAHLLFLEKCANFPIINANLYVTMNNKRLFRPFHVVRIGGMKILFIGILTQDVLDSARKEKIIGSFVDVAEAAGAIRVICDSYRSTDVDMTVILSHIGYEKDRELAELLEPELGVDFILGGHTHTFMEQADVVNGIAIVQAGTGTDVIGRFDVDYDTDSRKMLGWRWQCVPISEETAGPDPVMTALLNRYQQSTDTKYKRVVTCFRRKLTHPGRKQETELGNLIADLLQEDSSFDVMLYPSGGIRKTEMGPIVEYQDLMECFPFDEACWMLEVTGEQFCRMMRYMLREEAWTGHTEFYQVSRGVRIVFDRSAGQLRECSLNGEPISDEQRIRICLPDHHYRNFEKSFGISLEEISRNRKPKTVIVSLFSVLEEALSTHSDLDSQAEGRIVVTD